MKFVHCADLHLDSAFSGLSDGTRAAIRQQELRRTFLSIIELAKNADVLLIAGDLFDRNVVEPETIRVLKQGFASLGDTRVLIVTGNHDPLCENDFYRLIDFPENVHVFGTEMEKLTIADCDVFGISFGHNVEADPLLSTALPLSGRPSVLLMHGDLGGMEDYNPISRESLAASGVSYVALGHVHSYMIEKAGKTTYAYPGCPEGRGFDETGDKGVIVGEVTEAGVTCEFVSLCQRKHHELTIDVTGLATQEEMIGAIRSKGLNEKDLYKLILTGETEFSPDSDVLKSAFDDLFFVKMYDRTKRPLDIDALAKESGVRGMFVSKMLPVLSGDDAEQARKALEIGLAALDGRRVKTL